MMDAKAIFRLRGGLGRPRGLLPRGWQDWLLGLASIAVITLAISLVGSSSADSTQTQRTSTVGRGVVQSTVSGNGSLEAAEQVELDFGASGEVTAIYVKAGEEVDEGEILARVDSSSAQASLASARAQLSEAEETLEAAEEGESEEVSASYDEGATTVLAAYLSEGDSATGEEATVPSTGDGTEGTGGEPSGEGETKSGTGGEGSNSGEEESSSGSEPAGEEEVAPAESNAEPSTGGGVEEGAAGGASVSVATAEARLREARLSVRSAEREVRETTLRAPIAGTIASVSGEVGETVSGGSSSNSTGGGASEASSAAGVGGTTSSTATSSSSSSAFIVLSQLQQLKMEVSFSESDIGKVKVGQTATVSISSMEGTELAGRVTNVDVLPSEGSSGVVEYPATILLTQSARGLRAGMSATAEVVVEQVRNAVTVPSEAIASGPSKTVTVSEGGKEVEKTVTTGLVGDETTQVVSGLEPGETLVLPEVSVATGGGESGGGESGGFPAGGAFPSGGPPAGFPGG